MKKFFGLSLGLLLLLMNGCTSLEKKIQELDALVKKLEARIEAIEKLIMPPSEEPVAQQQAYEIPLEDSPAYPSDAPQLPIVVFSNFQCPYCARADKTLREIANDPALQGKVKIVFKHFPFDRHPEAKPAAKAALAAKEQGKFWEMTDEIFTHQDAMNEKNYKEWAKKIGLDVAKFTKDLKDNDQKYNEIIDRDIKMGVEKAKLEGTPWILVGGWLMQGELTAESVKKMIETKQLLPKN